jgi:hypothetical protein
LSHTHYLNWIFLVFCRPRTPNYPWRPNVSWLFLSPSPFPCDRRSCSWFNLNAVPICISLLGTTVLSNCSTLQLPNPDRASDRPMGTNPYRVSKWLIGTNLNKGRELPVRTGPVARLSGIQVAKRETRHGSRHDRRGAPLHKPHYSGPPPIRGKMARGVWNPLESH